jgi:hypothetical protein
MPRSLVGWTFFPWDELCVPKTDPTLFSGSRRFAPFVSVMKTAYSGQCDQLGGRCVFQRDGTLHRRFFAKPQVRSIFMIIREVGAQNPAQMILPEYNNVIQTLAANVAVPRSTYAFCQRLW